MQYQQLKETLNIRNKIKQPFKPQRKRSGFYSFSSYASPGVVALLLIAFFLLASFLSWHFYKRLPEAAERKIKSWMSWSRGRSFEIQSFNYGGMNASMSGITFNQVSMRLKVRYEAPYFPPRYVQIVAPILRVYFRLDLRNGFQIGVSCDGLKALGGDLLPDVAPLSRRLESISDLSFQAWIPAGRSPYSWKPAVLNWVRKFKRWALEGSSMADVYLSGNAFFVADGKIERVYFSSFKERNGATYLEGDVNDLRKIASIIEPKFTEEDVRIASKNFLKTPRLLHVRTLAEAKAEALYQVGSGISYDTFRHVFWSYYLTQAFGVDFARRVTDAHEAGDAFNTAHESEKDRRNNAIGIEYARNKLSEQDVGKIILTDPRILQNQIA